MKHQKQLEQWAKKRARMKAMLDAGATVRQIAKKYDLSMARTYVLLKKEGAVFMAKGAAQ